MKWLTTQQVAEEIGVTIRTVERWRESGEFVPEKRTSGNHSRYTERQTCEMKQKRELQAMMYWAS